MQLYHMSYSPNLSLAVTKKLPWPLKAPHCISFYSVDKLTGSRPRGALIGRSACWNIQSDTLLAAVIGRSRCSYVNEHLVAPAGPGCGARTEAGAAQPGLTFTLREGPERTDPGRSADILNIPPSPHCRLVSTASSSRERERERVP